MQPTRVPPLRLATTRSQGVFQGGLSCNTGHYAKRRGHNERCYTGGRNRYTVVVGFQVLD
ncbi:hypothetical protein BDM02DRAFT_1851319 [Thelephora ganbajun]|uniref:Uncharacterized protein n=1 Tax=Thelephora ganbajun TaxID=370292 RepID=A0ACB6ZI09_THEGA|nr:hypothetical protein BDM02DRAFT_1851319 [Thelephora ganbajun]